MTFFCIMINIMLSIETENINAMKLLLNHYLRLAKAGLSSKSA